MSAGVQIGLWALSLLLGLGVAGGIGMSLAGRRDPEFAQRLGLQALLVALALGPPAIGAWAFCTALGACAGVAAFEVRSVLSTRRVFSKSVALAPPLVVIGAAFGVLGGWLRLSPGLSLGLSLCALAYPFWFARATNTTQSRLAIVTCLAWPTVAVLAAVPMAKHPALLEEAAFLYGVLEVNDSVAFLVGRALGRRKLAPMLSPNKTWEGFAAGLLAAVVTGAALSFCLPAWSLATCALSALALACSGVVADLSASALKRALGVKDYGTLLGPHGGLLDAYDAWLLVLGAWAAVLELSRAP